MRTFALRLLFVLHLLSIERLVEGLLRKVVDITVLSALESLQELFLDLVIQPCCNKRLLFPPPFTAFNLPWQRDQLLLPENFPKMTIT